jgi:membrane protein
VASTPRTDAGLAGRVRGVGRSCYREGRELVERFGERDLLTYSSAIAFQVLFSLVPLALAGMAVLAFLGFEETWSDRIAPEVEEALPGDAYSVVERTVENVLGEGRVTWLTIGLAFTVWQISGAVRAASGALNEIYDVDEARSTVRRAVVSVALALAIIPLVVLAVLFIGLGDRLLGEVGIEGVAGFLADVGRWILGIACLQTAVWLVVRFAPGESPPGNRWVSLGSGLTVAGWLVTAALYGLYIEYVASYESMFGALAAVIVLMTFVNLLSVVFMAGAQIDGMARERNGR